MRSQICEKCSLYSNRTLNANSKMLTVTLQMPKSTCNILFKYSSETSESFTMNFDPYQLSEISDYFCDLFFPAKPKEIEVKDRFPIKSMNDFLCLCFGQTIDNSDIFNLFEIDKIACKWKVRPISDSLCKYFNDVKLSKYQFHLFCHQALYHNDVKSNYEKVMHNIEVSELPNLNEKDAYNDLIKIEPEITVEFFKVMRQTEEGSKKFSDLEICDFFLKTIRIHQLKSLVILGIVDMNNMPYQVINEMHSILSRKFHVKILSSYIEEATLFTYEEKFEDENVVFSSTEYDYSSIYDSSVSALNSSMK
ncbi:hypothetical protein TRFO_40774 [Tritrichomonas foetus]|uniref:BTB domain-containing protein n=1 Tax=Tritrichomonas foetus TaxID=1144522 RepID=A0A1J4J424_9EUKA|nr:hypothetical protein TRFO_40774 [Tritrichomonas foetus]|eukprot:OHS92903.1 hypothetical protein TRFO_40774 [Tritrichomonas foetus]